MKILSRAILVLMIVTHHNSFSQEASTLALPDPKHLITLSTGFSFHSVRDEMISPLIYRGTKAPIELSYSYSGLSNRHKVSLYYDDSELNSSITDNLLHYIKNLNLSFEYSFATKITTLDDFKTKCFLGIRFSSILNFRNQYFIQGISHASAEQMTSLGVYILTETSFQNASKNLLSIGINIPFITYALLNSRYNAYVSGKFDNLNFEENILWQIFKRGDLVTFNKLFEIQADISYNIFVSSHIGFGLRYRFQYYSFEQYESLLYSKVLNNQFLIGMMVKL